MGAAPPARVQRLDKGNVRQQSTPGWPFEIADRDCSRSMGSPLIWAAHWIRPGVDVSRRDSPYSARVEGALPRGIAAERHRVGREAVRVFILAECVMIWKFWPKTSVNSVASGRAGSIVQDVPPVPVRKQTYACEPRCESLLRFRQPPSGVLAGKVGWAFVLR